MKITPQICAAAYTFLTGFAPFTGLPAASEVQFKITRSLEDRGYYHAGGGSKEYLIAISSKVISHMDSLLKVMAHEMLHMYQEINNTETRDIMHNKEFWALGHQFSHEMGWDPGMF